MQEYNVKIKIIFWHGTPTCILQITLIGEGNGVIDQSPRHAPCMVATTSTRPSEHLSGCQEQNISLVFYNHFHVAAMMKAAVKQALSKKIDVK